MKGLELSRLFYEEYGRAMIDELFPNEAGRIAIGLAGEGSECLGYDDDVSCDHDFEPGFCLWISREDEERFGFRLERAYSKLPRNFMGYSRQIQSPVGGNRHGVIVIDEFYKRFLGAPSAPDSLMHWLYLPSHSLLCASNGEVFRDDLGAFSAVRETVKRGYPIDVKLKKLAAHAVFMYQSGIYNYERCVKRGESAAAQLAVFEFVKHAISFSYLMNDKYEPFYKWAYRGMKDFTLFADIAPMLEEISTTPNNSASFSEKTKIINTISDAFCRELVREELSGAKDNNLEAHAYSIIKRISDANLRNMHIMEGV